MNQKTRDDLVVGGSVRGNQQGRLQCQAAKILRTIADELTAQCQGHSYFNARMADVVFAKELMRLAREEQWKSFCNFTDSIMNPRRKLAKRKIHVASVKRR
jgi:hypothetical protein